MKRLFTQILSFYLLLPTLALAQEQNLEGPKQGHTNQNKFRQLYNEFSTPNDYRTASGAPGTAYYQQRADYVMDIKIVDETQRLYGEETITYTNNSPDELAYLWVQLDQNIRKKDSPSLLKNSQSMDQVSQLSTFTLKENTILLYPLPTCTTIVFENLSPFTLMLSSVNKCIL